MTFQFNEQQLSELQTFFQKIDHDQDQRISFKDLEEIYAFLGLHPTEEQLAALIPSSQTDKLTFPMFVNLVAESIAENSFLTEQLVEAFQTFSYNNPSSPARLDTLLKDFKKWSKSTDEQMAALEGYLKRGKDPLDVKAALQEFAFIE